ncbi:hypothetical protein Tco_0547977 [Tanacetum coccineum]
MNELVNDDIKLLKLEINTGFINRLPKKWLSLCQSLRNTNHVKDYELASLFGKLKYEENLIGSIYETEKNKSLISATPRSIAFFSTSIIQDFQDSPDDEEDTRRSQEYLNDLEEEYQARVLLAKSKRFFKKVPSYQSPFQPKLLNSSQLKPELRPTKDFEAKYNKVKAKLALLSSSASASKASIVKNKGLIAEAYEWDEKEVSSDNNEMVEVKVLMALAKDNDAVSKEGARNGEWLKISIRKCISEQIPIQKNILGVNQLTDDPSTEGFIMPNHDTVTNSLGTDYDSTNESSVCSTLLPQLEKLDGDEPVSGPKTIKSILKSKFTFKAEEGIIINKPSSALAKGNKSTSASKVNSAPIVCGSYDHEINGHNRIISLEKEIKPRNLQHVIKRCETCGSIVHNTTDHYDIKLFKRGEVLHAKNADALKSKKTGSSKANRSKTPTRGYQRNRNDVSIEPYESHEPVVLETKVSSDQNGQTDQNDQSAQTDEILNDDQSEHSNHTNDEQIIDNLYNTEDIQISELLSSLNVEDTSIHDTIPILNLELSKRRHKPR